MSQASWSDKDLLAAYAGGDEAAFAELAKRYAGLVLGRCRRCLGGEDAESASQAVFLILARQAGRIRVTGSLGGWLMKTAWHVCQKMLRARTRRLRTEQQAAEALDTGREAPIDRSLLEPVLDQALNAIPGRQREAILLHFLAGQSQTQLAAQMGLPLTTVNDRIRRGLEQLRRRLARLGVPVASASALAPVLMKASTVDVSTVFISSLCGLARADAPPESVMALAEETMKAMLWTKIKLAALILGATVIAGGGGVAIHMAAAEPARPEESSAERQLNSKLLEMPDNSWLKLSPPREPKSRAYSGCCFGDGLLWHFGGAHRSYMGNEVELYDPIKNIWTASEKEWPEPEDIQLIASVKAPRQPLTPKGRPWTAHTYQQVCYVPERKAFFYVGRGHTWEFSPAKLDWTCLAGPASKDKKPSPQYQGSQSVHLLYDPRLKAPVAVTTTAPFGIFVYDYTRMEWQRHKDAPMKWDELYSTCITSSGLHLVSGMKTGMWLFDAVKEEWKPLENVPETLKGCRALAYDSVNDIVLAMTKPAGEKQLALWVMDVKTLTWTEQKPANPGPLSAEVWAPLWYDPDHQVFLYLSFDGRGVEFVGGETSTWAYRYKRTEKK